jgi:hypothetical protein
MEIRAILQLARCLEAACMEPARQPARHPYMMIQVVFIALLLLPAPGDIEVRLEIKYALGVDLLRMLP